MLVRTPSQADDHEDNTRRMSPVSDGDTSRPMAESTCNCGQKMDILGISSENIAFPMDGTFKTKASITAVSLVCFSGRFCRE